MYVNQQIEIEVKLGPYKGSYQSKIAAVEDNQIKILPPYNDGGIVPLRSGREINILYTGKDAAYKFKTRVIDRIKENIPLLIIEPPEQIVRIQRRDFFRLDVKIDVKYRKLDEERKPLEEYIATKTCDLSGGGARIVLESDLEEEDIVELLIDIDEIKNIPLRCKVRETYNLPNGKAAGLEFIEINRKVRDLIIGWLFDYQRELRKKGLL